MWPTSHPKQHIPLQISYGTLSAPPDFDDGTASNCAASGGHFIRSLWLLLWMAYPAISAEPAPAAESKPPAQAARGQATFLDEANATHCGACSSVIPLVWLSMTCYLSAIRRKHVIRSGSYRMIARCSTFAPGPATCITRENAEAFMNRMATAWEVGYSSIC